MSYNLRNMIFPFSVLILFSCRIKTKLNTSELKWMNVYSVNDTLIFKSQRGDFDTSIIIKKDLFCPEYNPVEQHGKYLPQWGVVWYKNKNLIYHPDGDRLITMEKTSKKKTFLVINYLYTGFMFLDITTDSLKKYKKTGVYEFNTEVSRPDALQPKQIFWDEKYGIVRYKTHSNDVWERVNLPK